MLWIFIALSSANPTTSHLVLTKDFRVVNVYSDKCQDEHLLCLTPNGFSLHSEEKPGPSGYTGCHVGLAPDAPSPFSDLIFHCFSLFPFCHSASAILGFLTLPSTGGHVSTSGPLLNTAPFFTPDIYGPF